MTISPAEVKVPENVGDALVASPRLLASVKSPRVNHPLLAEFLIFNKLFAVSAHILYATVVEGSAEPLFHD